MTFDQQLISDYLRLESIEAVFKEKNYDIPISFAGFARLLNKNNIVTTAGPNSHLSESLYFFSLLKEYGGSVARLHKKLNLNISTKTLNRILHNIRMGVTRRYGTAMLIEDIDRPDYFLFGQDISLRQPFGKSGDWSLPMCHTREQDSHYNSVVRVLQREVFTNKAIFGKFPYQLIPQNIRPIFDIDVLDIKVHVYHLKIKEMNYSSNKLTNHRFIDIHDTNSFSLRLGVPKIIEKFLYLHDQAKIS